MKYKYVAFTLSGIVIVAGIINISSGKGLNLGIDFSGGTLIRVLFKDAVPIEQLRQSLKDAGLGGSIIQETKGKEQREYSIRTAQAVEKTEEEQELEAHEIMGNRVVDALRGADEKLAFEKGLRDLNSIDEKSLAALLEASSAPEPSGTARKIIDFRVGEGIINDFSQLRELGISEETVVKLREKTFLGRLTVLSRETVGPQVGRDLRIKATQATIWALIGMFVYIAFRFKVAYGVSAILTLAHDVLITLSIYSFTNREINLPVIAAILTIVGYSINDTIVIFDRVRDNLKMMRKHPLEEILNASVNQTLSRSIITSGTLFMTVAALYFFGGEVINDFAFVMIIGVIEGSYSTIYQSCPIVYFWSKIFKPKKGMRR